MAVQNIAGDAIKQGVVGRFLTRLGTNHLLLAVGALFVLDLLLLDPIPFLDEIVLAVLTILIARWQGRKGDKTTPASAQPSPVESGREVKNVTPPKI